jgi:hypothetical protein
MAGWGFGSYAIFYITIYKLDLTFWSRWLGKLHTQSNYYSKL